MRPPYICFWFFRSLGGLFWVWCLVFENIEIIFWIRNHIFGGFVLKTFWFEASLHIFLIIWNFRGFFLSLIFGFWKYQNCISNQNSHFWGSVLWNFLIWGFLDDFIYSSGKFFFSIFGHQGNIGATWKWSYHVEEIDTVI